MVRLLKFENRQQSPLREMGPRYRFSGNSPAFDISRRRRPSFWRPAFPEFLRMTLKSQLRNPS